MTRHQFEFWVTREASAAINLAAERLDIPRGTYIQDAIWEALEPHVDEQRDHLLPKPHSIRNDYIRYADHKPGYKGRWSMWVRARAHVHPSVPFLLNAAAVEEGFGSATALLRHHLQAAIYRDTGRKVPMPKGRSEGSYFGGVVHESVR